MNQLGDPLKRPLLLAIYKAIRKLYPHIVIEDQEFFDKAIEEDKCVSEPEQQKQ